MTRSEVLVSETSCSVMSQLMTRQPQPLGGPIGLTVTIPEAPVSVGVYSPYPLVSIMAKGVGDTRKLSV